MWKSISFILLSVILFSGCGSTPTCQDCSTMTVKDKVFTGCQAMRSGLGANGKPIVFVECEQ